MKKFVARLVYALGWIVGANIALNEYYDSMKEPARFLTFIGAILVGVILVNLVPVVGWTILLLMLSFRMIGYYAKAKVEKED